MADADANIACVAARIPLHFNRLSSAAREQEQRLMTNHMRVCLGVTTDHEYIYTFSPSEPILAEGARLAMMEPSFRLSETLKKFLDTAILDVGTCGELMVAAQLLKAQDYASPDSRARGGPLKAFLSQFLGPEVEPRFWTERPSCARSAEACDLRSLEERYPNGMVWFNHFIQVEDSDVLGSNCLWTFVLRGAAIKCKVGQEGCDFVVPVICDSTKPIGPLNVSAILIQVKNDYKYTKHIQQQLFTKMNPYTLRILPRTSSHAVIRVVCALSAPSAGCAMLQNSERRSERNAAEVATKRIAADYNTVPCTAFDFWSYGATHRTFNVMRPDEESDYRDILRILLRRVDMFTRFSAPTNDAVYNPEREQCRRVLYPAARADWRHINKWAKLESDDQRADKVKEQDYDIFGMLADPPQDDTTEISMDIDDEVDADPRMHVDG